MLWMFVEIDCLLFFGFSEQVKIFIPLQMKEREKKICYEIIYY